SISFPKERSAQPLDGRMLLLLSNDASAEPRMQIGLSAKTQIVFGLDVDALAPNQPITIDDANSFGYPIRHLRDVPQGEYFVQVVLHRYETFHRADGHTIKLPMDRGEGQHWNFAPGNLFSNPQEISIGSDSDVCVQLLLDQETPPIDPPKDTKYIRHVRIESKLLSKFWGRPMYL